MYLMYFKCIWLIAPFSLENMCFDLVVLTRVRQAVRSPLGYALEEGGAVTGSFYILGLFPPGWAEAFLERLDQCGEKVHNYLQAKAHRRILMIFGQI